MGRTQIGTGLAVRSAPGVGRLVVRLSNAGRARLARMVRARGGKVAVTLRTTAIDAAGTTSAADRRA